MYCVNSYRSQTLNWWASVTKVIQCSLKNSHVLLHASRIPAFADSSTTKSQWPLIRMNTGVQRTDSPLLKSLHTLNSPKSSGFERHISRRSITSTRRSCRISTSDTRRSSRHSSAKCSTARLRWAPWKFSRAASTRNAALSNRSARVTDRAATSRAISRTQRTIATQYRMARVTSLCLSCDYSSVPHSKYDKSIGALWILDLGRHLLHILV